ncbi:hypothetical protein [Sedimentibacter sp.]|uniref:hypothetical protein n=1 Tax=Sedimentibacter sp. TaxID=1960295 RepID=UPI0028B0FE16|nr:hypothetical protein [Sedimentibacter sp.]
MEQRKNNFTSLLLYSLKSKKNWFLLSTVIIFITTMLIPFILGIGGEFFIAFGIVEVFILAFVNCLVDSSFLHNDSKLAYYKSKPLSFKDQIFINIISNHIFTGFLLILVLLSDAVQNYNIDILEIYKVIIPWLSAGIFLSALSSILSGNTLVAGLMTIFNFALPAIFYLIIQFMFSILEDLVIGFSSNVLMEYFVDAFYKLDYIYLIAYSYNSIDIVYFLILGVIIAFITFLILKMIKRRKNENTGNFMVFDGYKYFVSVLASLIIPALFSISSYDRSVASEVMVSLLLAALSYYIIIAIMEKAFRISRLSIKVFLVSMASFIVLTGATVLFANQYKNVVPAPEDVKAAYIGGNRWAYREANRYFGDEDILNDENLSEFESYYYNRNIILFTDKANIEKITELHKEILDNQGYDNDEFYINNVVINYYMNDGSILIRDYRIKNDENSENKVKDEIASDILKSEELKEKKFFYLYNEDYYLKNKDNIKVVLSNDRGEAYSPDENISLEHIRPHLIKDIDTMLHDSDKAFMILNSYNLDWPARDYKENYYLQITVANKDNSSKDVYQTIYLDDRLVNTREFLGIK